MTVGIDDPAGGFHHHSDGTFRKRMPTDRARCEAQGWQSISGHLPVAPLLGDITHPCGEHTLIYEDVFAGRRCEYLLADLINKADQDHREAPKVRPLVDAVCDSWLDAAAATGSLAPIGDCQPALYSARLAPGGRLDAWYGPMTPLVVDTGACTTKLDIPALLVQLRVDLAPGAVCATAVTQGDPTEPNIADPLCWLDYEHAGRNSLAGEAANLLWYLLAMGGWLVPLYKPLTYARTVHTAVSPLVPAVTYLRTEDGHLDVAGHIRAGAGRRAAITALLRRLEADLGVIIGVPGQDAMAALRPWLALRILGALPLTAMYRKDAAICLAKLVQALDPRTRLEDFAATPAPAERNFP
ncbi:hypothetical protein AB0B89_01640 [Sphaerisporangium sp. NPDC049002]|uniref:hypothetical protein n=1 Tax=unclassified Sphaerisporangium TaxID=2630420 RepID=UPI0033CD66E2